MQEEDDIERDAQAPEQSLASPVGPSERHRKTKFSNLVSPNRFRVLDSRRA